MSTLGELMKDNLSKGGVHVNGGAQDRYMEVSEPATGKIWMCLDPVSKEEFANLDLDDNYQPFGTAPASMDAAMFQHSPLGDGRDVEQRTISGYRFAHVATPGEIKFSEHPDGAAEVMVSKAHTIGFKAGRNVTVMKYNSEYFIELIGDDRHDAELMLPEGASLEIVELDNPLIVSLPTPTRTFWWFSKGRSFQGPVKLP